MKSIFRKLLIATLAIIVLGTVSYAYIQRHAELDLPTRLYQSALVPVHTRENVFYPEGQLELFDSLVGQHPGFGRSEMMLHAYREQIMLQLGREKDATADLSRPTRLRIGLVVQTREAAVTCALKTRTIW